MFPKMNEPIDNKKITKIFPPEQNNSKEKTSKEKINSEEEKG